MQQTARPTCCFKTSWISPEMITCIGAVRICRRGARLTYNKPRRRFKTTLWSGASSTRRTIAILALNRTSGRTDESCVINWFRSVRCGTPLFGLWLECLPASCAALGSGGAVTVIWVDYLFTTAGRRRRHHVLPVMLLSGKDASVAS